MPIKVTPPQYMQIALDIASRISRGELKEGLKLCGRSTLASEYGVSHETIRRSMRLLADMRVVEIMPKSGAVICSTENSDRYIEHFGNQAGLRSLQIKLRQMIAQHRDLSKRIADTAAAIAQIGESSPEFEPFQNHEIQVPPDCAVVHTNLDELNFWQATGATIIAIRRAEGLTLSPGPRTQIQLGDVLIFVGDASSVTAVERFIFGVSE